MVKSLHVDRTEDDLLEVRAEKLSFLSDVLRVQEGQTHTASHSKIPRSGSREQSDHRTDSLFPAEISLTRLEAQQKLPEKQTKKKTLSLHFECNYIFFLFYF